MKADYKSICNLVDNKTTGIKFSTLAKICEVLHCNIKDILVLKKTVDKC
ncbi:MAG: helix-turn-helix domain-containing protein [Clostridia bacterium]|nr:helix-turn-helix domain-containing protein [Clostridia bacterium]